MGKLAGSSSHYPEQLSSGQRQRQPSPRAGGLGSLTLKPDSALDAKKATELRLPLWHFCENHASVAARKGDG